MKILHISNQTSSIKSIKEAFKSVPNGTKVMFCGDTSRMIQNGKVTEEFKRFLNVGNYFKIENHKDYNGDFKELKVKKQATNDHYTTYFDYYGDRYSIDGFERINRNFIIFREYYKRKKLKANRLPK